MTVPRRAAEIEQGSILASRHAAEKNHAFRRPASRCDVL